MKKLLLVLVSFVVFVGILAVGAVFYGVYTLNRFAGLDETANADWAQVENQYQRRADLIPNLVNTVKGYAAHEQNTFTQVVEARNNALQTPLPSTDLSNVKTFQAYQQAQDNLSAALNRLLVVVERYPELKANQNFLALQDQLEGTENRIAAARKDYIETVRVYNIQLRQIPAGWVAKTFGSYQAKQTFAATQGAEQAPVVSFE